LPLDLPPGGAAIAPGDATSADLPVSRASLGDRGVLPQLHRGRGRGGGCLLIRSDGHQEAWQPTGRVSS